MFRADVLLEMGELGVAQAVLDARLKAEKKAEALPAVILATLRERALLAEESAVDDDLASLTLDAKRIGEAATHPDANDEDRAAWAWALLMADAPGRARKASDDAMTTAGIAYAKKPTPERRAALFAASSEHPERAVRLVLQRSEPVVEEARALYATRATKAPLPDRHTLRALRLLVAALRVVGDPESETLHALDPEHGLTPEDALALRKARLGALEGLLGAECDLLCQPYYALSYAAREAGELSLSVEMALRTDDFYAKRRGEGAAIERSCILVRAWRDLVKLGRYDEAVAVVERDEAVHRQRGLDVPLYMSRAEICEARGDWEGCLQNWRLAVVQARESTHPAYGPGSNNLRLTEGWLQQARERIAKKRG